MPDWDRPARRRIVRTHTTPDASGPVPFEVAVEVMLRRSGWATRTQTTAREILMGGRFTGFREVHGIATIGQLTDEHATEFLAGCRDAGLAPGTLIKIRQVIVNLQHFCAATPGYGSGMAAAEELPIPRVPVRLVPVISPSDEVAVLKACLHERDRLIVETMLATGIRIGELCALRVTDLRLDDRRPHIEVRRSVGEAMTKSGRDRVVPLDWAGSSLSRRLRTYVDKRRPPSHRLEVFLTRRPDSRGDHTALTPDGIRKVLARINQDTGLHLYPHLFRHTWATRAANAGVPVKLLQEAGGWASLTMVQRYLTADRRAVLDAFARAHWD